ncbi:hypothetical protein FBY33_1245 [Arthrobacter sp. SLBN-112]|jgi:hypothetical protein|nr:hypothetical protein FBY33_1245 [Arthrobacter sp. SLBN-112]
MTASFLAGFFLSFHSAGPDWDNAFALLCGGCGSSPVSELKDDRRPAVF